MGRKLVQPGGNLARNRGGIAEGYSRDSSGIAPGIAPKIGRGKNPPTWGEKPLNLGENPPNLGEKPPNLGEKPRNLGENTPNLVEALGGINPTTWGKTPPTSREVAIVFPPAFGLRA